MQEQFRALLIADSGVLAAVDTRVSWGLRPRGSAMPAVALHKIDGNPDYVNSGPSGLISSRVQADCWGRTYADATAAARAIKSVLSGLSATQGGIQFQGIFLDAERDLSDDGTEAEDELFRISLDFMVWHTE